MMAAPSLPGIRGVLHYREPLATLNSWRVGGPAQCFFRPADLEDLSVFLAAGEVPRPITWLGLGSNVLIRDGGIPGTVIAVHAALDYLERRGDARIYAQAGVPCAKVARTAARAGLVGAEFLAGIPGTMGGALAMNAGAFGGETWSRVCAVQTIDASGRVRERPLEDFRVGYRSVRGPENEWFVAALLELEEGDGVAAMERIRQLLARRGETQPMGLPSCGSVFRNPPGDHAARLIEAAGLKGHRIGGACVSEKHANFIINTGEATAADIESLIEHVRDRVQRSQGVLLVPEVRIMGVPNP